MPSRLRPFLFACRSGGQRRVQQGGGARELVGPRRPVLLQCAAPKQEGPRGFPLRAQSGPGAGKRQGHRPVTSTRSRPCFDRQGLVPKRAAAANSTRWKGHLLAPTTAARSLYCYFSAATPRRPSSKRKLSLPLDCKKPRPAGERAAAPPTLSAHWLAARAISTACSLPAFRFAARVRGE